MTRWTSLTGQDPTPASYPRLVVVPCSMMAHNATAVVHFQERTPGSDLLTKKPQFVCEVGRVVPQEAD